jgi:hypothetical protein
VSGELGCDDMIMVYMKVKSHHFHEEVEENKKLSVTSRLVKI